MRRTTIARTFYTSCAVLFLLGVVFKFNGSSVFCWRIAHNDTECPGGLLFSVPNWERSDEWYVWTPAALSQSSMSPQFPEENPSLGAGKSPFLYSLPVRHYSMLVRPQLWGFFLLDFERGYSWYWNFKIFALCAAMFGLFLLLTKKPAMALAGSLWVFFASYTQWWFSCPPMLPEMLANWAIACLCAISIMTSPDVSIRWMASTGLFFSLSGFILCMYPPFQIPLLYLGVLICTVMIRQRHPDVKNGKQPLFLIAALVFALVFVVPLFIELGDTLKAVSNTLYPGQRRSIGGGMKASSLLSGLITFFMNQETYPEGFDNANVAANFYPLWIPATVAALWCGWRHRKPAAMHIVLLACIVFFCLYMFIPFPQWLRRVTLLEYTRPNRLLLAMGLAGIFLALTVLSGTSWVAAFRSKRVSLLFGGSLSVLSVLYVATTAHIHPEYMTPTRIALLGAINISIMTGFFLLPSRIFVFVFVGLLALSNAAVNPIMAGLSPLLQSTPRNVIGAFHEKDPDAAWMAYGHNGLAQLAMSTGARVLGGSKIVPDPDFYRELDPGGKHEAVYNNLALVFFVPSAKTEDASFEKFGFLSHFVHIHPSHTVFGNYNVKYFLSDRPLPAYAVQDLKLVHAGPQNRLWIYRRAMQSRIDSGGKG